MTRSEILDTLVSLGREVFDEPELRFGEQTDFEKIEAWDSMSHVHMVVGMERAFSIRFGIGDLQRLARVADLIDVIERLRARAGTA
jgi:acyl carrier protein